MDIKGLTVRLKESLNKYKYAAIVLLVGVGLLLIPKKNDVKQNIEVATVNQQKQTFETADLVEILQSVQGAGKVKVLLSIGSGEQIIYQTNSEVSISGDSNSTNSETVIVTDSQKAQTGLINQVNPPKYLGAIVVCQGADSATVRLAVTQAVAKLTGLGTDEICVLKME